MFLKPKSYNLKAIQGYTLVEAIIYVAILALLSVVFISLLFTMVKSYTQFRLTREIVDSASVGLERLTYEIRRATAVNAGSVLDTHPGGLLRLDTTDGNGLAITTDFYLSAGTLMIEEGSAAPASTTADRIEISNLVFRQINTIKSSAVKVEMTLTSTRGQVSRTEKFYSTVVLRGSY